MFHVYVDPIHGDNRVAACVNPGAEQAAGSQPAYYPNMGPLSPPGSVVGPLDFHPSPSASKPAGVIVHAPFPFRTVTTPLNGPPGALSWVNATFPNLPFGGNGFIIDAVVIHCLPGLYGPVQPGPGADPTTGLLRNGEDFPILLRNRVCLQGTSAMDTIFDGGNMNRDIVVLPNPVINTKDLERTFVDGIAFRRSRTPAGNALLFGAVKVDGEGAVAATISNCVFADNDYGIVIRTEEDEVTSHCPRIVNNTLAWNGVGIWNGWRNLQSQTQLSRGLPIVLNNVIDAQGSQFAFYGIHQNHCTVATLIRDVGGSQVTQPVGVDFNAYRSSNSTAGGTFPAGWGWPATNLSPKVDLGFLSTAPRGVFFVNDLLRVRVPGAGLSVHDFRLAPHVVEGANTPASWPASRNLCVDAGISIGSAPSGEILQLNYSFGAVVPSISLTGAPGLPVYAEHGPGATFHAWDEDCEGFGNPRVIRKAGFPVDPDLTGIDIGADEMGELIVTGYNDWTRSFLSPDFSCLPGVQTRQNAYFVAPRVPNGSGGFFSFVRPTHNYLSDATQPWLTHKQWTGAPSGCGPTDYDPQFECFPSEPAVLSNFTRSVGGGQRSQRIAGLHSYPVPRTLVCDFGGILLPDLHPFWGPDGFMQDPYGQNSGYNTTSTIPFGGGPASRFDNPFVFHNPPGSPTNSMTAWPGIVTHRVEEGVVNPPNTYSSPVDMLANYVLNLNRGFAWGAAWSTSPTPGAYDVDAWGLGDIWSADPVPAIGAGFGTRWNLEPYHTGTIAGVMVPKINYNLQAFLAVSLPAPERAGPSREKTGRLIPSLRRKPTIEGVLQLLRRSR